MGNRAAPSCIFALVLAQLLPAPCAAMVDDSGPVARHRVSFESLTAGQWNPWGLQTDLLLAYRYRLFSSASPLLRSAFAGVHGIARINPAFARIGAGLELQPLAVITLRVRYEHRGYYGTAGMLQGYASPGDEHDDETNARRSAAGLAYATSGRELALQATLRGKLGPIAVLDELALHHFDMRLQRGEQLFYDAFFDTLAPARGWVFVHNAHLLYLASSRLIFGVRYTMIHADYSAAPAGNPNTPTHKIGPLAAYVFSSSSTWLRRPTLILFANWWLRSRYRTGQAVSQAIPYGVLAFRVDGDLWSR